MISTFLVKTSDISPDETNKFFLIRKICFPYQRTITKYPHTRLILIFAKYFTINDNDYVIYKCKLRLMSSISSPVNSVI